MVNITKYCRIKNGRFLIDDRIIFNGGPGDNFKTLSKKIYKLLEPDYPKFYKMDNLSKLGFLCAEALLKDSEVLRSYKLKDIGIFIQNSNSSLDTDKNYFNTIRDENNYFPSPSVFVYTLPNIMLGEISIKNKITGEQLCLVSEKFDVELLYSYINELFENNAIQCCFAGWVDYLEEDYDAFLCLIEKIDSIIQNKDSLNTRIFNIENIDKLYNNMEN